MFNSFLNTGVIKDKLNDEAFNKLKLCIKNKKNRTNASLAGNISDSFALKDKDDWFLKNVLLSLIYQYSPEDINNIVGHPLTKNCAYALDGFWVNIQNKYEFNPSHNHSGIFSFVVWVKIPSSYKKEKKLKFVKETNSPCPNTFEFTYTNILGSVCQHKYHLEPEDEKTIILFPSKLVHQVYPFYLSDKKRISVSGNIKLDPTKIK